MSCFIMMTLKLLTTQYSPTNLLCRVFTSLKVGREGKKIPPLGAVSREGRGNSLINFVGSVILQACMVKTLHYLLNALFLIKRLSLKRQFVQKLSKFVGLNITSESKFFPAMIPSFVPFTNRREKRIQWQTKGHFVGEKKHVDGGGRESKFVVGVGNFRQWWNSLKSPLGKPCYVLPV